jgi:hypothetical protein
MLQFKGGNQILNIFDPRAVNVSSPPISGLDGSRCGQDLTVYRLISTYHPEIGAPDRTHSDNNAHFVDYLRANARF